jgi:hypothetical protein
MSGMYFGFNSTQERTLRTLAGGIPLATTSTAGIVKKSATVAAVSAATPAAAPAGGTGATAGAYDTAVNRDAMIATVNGLRTEMIDVKAQLNALIAALKAAGTVA